MKQKMQWFLLISSFLVLLSWRHALASKPEPFLETPSMENTSSHSENNDKKTTEYANGERIRDIFPDPNLAQAVADQVGKTVDDAVTEAELLSIARFRNPIPNVNNLTGLERLLNLTIFVSPSGGVSDLRPLQNLVKLRILILGHSTPLPMLLTLINRPDLLGVIGDSGVGFGVSCHS